MKKGELVRLREKVGKQKCALSLLRKEAVKQREEIADLSRERSELRLKLTEAALDGPPIFHDMFEMQLDDLVLDLISSKAKHKTRKDEIACAWLPILRKSARKLSEAIKMRGNGQGDVSFDSQERVIPFRVEQRA